MLSLVRVLVFFGPNSHDFMVVQNLYSHSDVLAYLR